MKALRNCIWIATIVILGACGTYTADRGTEPCRGITYTYYGRSDTILISILYLLSEDNVKVVNRRTRDTTRVFRELEQDAYIEFDIRTIEPMDTLVEVFQFDSVTQAFLPSCAWTGNDIIEMYRNEVE